jgi:hypothetical protein
MVLLWSALAHIGVRPWGVYAKFEVSEWKLAESWTRITQVRVARSESYEGLIPLEYRVVSRAQSPHDERRHDYTVGVPHVTGGTLDILSAQLVQSPSAPLQRVFDIDLRCLTAVWHACRGFVELAPSAWADYQTSKHIFSKEKRQQ